MSYNNLNGTASAALLRISFAHLKTMTIRFVWECFWGHYRCCSTRIVADGLGSNSTLVKIDLSSCALRRCRLFYSSADRLSDTTLQLIFHFTRITSTGVGALLEVMEQGSHITNLEPPVQLYGTRGTVSSWPWKTICCQGIKHLSLSDCELKTMGS
jgi:hypothetical protein